MLFCPLTLIIIHLLIDTIKVLLPCVTGRWQPSPYPLQLVGPPPSARCGHAAALPECSPGFPLHSPDIATKLGFLKACSIHSTQKCLRYTSMCSNTRNLKLFQVNNIYFTTQNSKILIIVYV